jgi:hypothetical protein
LSSPNLITIADLDNLNDRPYSPSMANINTPDSTNNFLQRNPTVKGQPSFSDVAKDKLFSSLDDRHQKMDEFLL